MICSWEFLGLEVEKSSRLKVSEDITHSYNRFAYSIIWFGGVVYSHLRQGIANPFSTVEDLDLVPWFSLHIVGLSTSKKLVA
ncbi:hypothetical protein MRB53_002117 [Persea americana]|uniref:Uncharacterized protein n=1 Tax=Persea americana TaxID=3435 RepID=A0ACC2MV80_PERAE|nr:hypothetical protein MRB53_002117 [Persea americana]